MFDVDDPISLLYIAEEHYNERNYDECMVCLEEAIGSIAGLLKRVKEGREIVRGMVTKEWVEQKLIEWYDELD